MMARLAVRAAHEKRARRELLYDDLIGRFVCA